MKRTTVLMCILALLAAGLLFWKDWQLGVLAVTLGIVCGFYFLPAMVAIATTHPHRHGIVLLNLMLGWTLLGWVVAFVWAFARPQRMQQAC